MRGEITQQNFDPTTLFDEVGRDNALESDNTNSESSEDVPDQKDLDKTKKSLMIFNDLQLEKQNKCEKYYIIDTAMMSASILPRIIPDYQGRQ
jgi:hypothetical protein